MKTMISRVVTLVVVLSLVLTFCACGSEKSKFVGTWETTLDMTDVFNESMGLDEELAEYIAIDEFAITMLFTFNSDGTYKIVADEDKMADTIDNLIENVRDGMTNYFEAMIIEEELDMTLDELFDLSGITMDEIVNDLRNELDVDDLVGGIESEGKFDAKGGKLYLTDGLSSGFDRSEYDAYEFSGKELKLIEHVGGDDDDESALLYPITLKKRK